jgi:hypothetical protein
MVVSRFGDVWRHTAHRDYASSLGQVRPAQWVQETIGAYGHLHRRQACNSNMPAPRFEAMGYPRALAHRQGQRDQGAALAYGNPRETNMGPALERPGCCQSPPLQSVINNNR